MKYTKMAWEQILYSSDCPAFLATTMSSERKSFPLAGEDVRSDVGKSNVS